MMFPRGLLFSKGCRRGGSDGKRGWGGLETGEGGQKKKIVSLGRKERGDSEIQGSWAVERGCLITSGEKAGGGILSSAVNTMPR